MAFGPAEVVGGAAVGTGVGQAVGTVVEPQLQGLKNEQWAKHAERPIDPYFLAQGVSQGQIDLATARTIALHSGISEDNLDHMIEIANVGPGVATAFDLWRRDEIGESGFRRAVKRLGLEQEWIDDLVKLRTLRISPSEVANAVQQGHVPNDGVLPNISPAVTPAVGQSDPDTPDGKPPSHVPLTQIDLDPIKEAAAHGIDRERLQVLANLVGLPPGPETLLAMWNRGLIDEESVDAGIREGHMKTKWTGAFKRMRWAVLSGQEYAEAQLREWITPAEMYAGGALTGHTKEQMDLLFKNRGRPASPTQMWTAWARKVIGPRGVPTDYTDHERAIRRSNIRPEYAPMLWDIRYTYPPYFQVSRLVLAGAIDSDTGADWMHKNRAAPEVVAAFVKYWNESAGGTAAKVDPLVKSARTQAVTEIRSAFLLGQSDETQARDWLGRVGVTVDAQDGLLPIWNVMREVPQKGLTPTQIVKAYKKLPTLWPRGRAVDELTQLGLTVDDANTLLDE